MQINLKLTEGRTSQNNAQGIVSLTDFPKAVTDVESLNTFIMYWFTVLAGIQNAHVLSTNLLTQK